MEKDPFADEFGINPAKLAWATRRRDSPDKFGEPTKEDLDLIKLAEKRNKDKPKKYKDIIKELKSKATFNKKAKYTPILKKLTRGDKLERNSVQHQWRYSKK